MVSPQRIGRYLVFEAFARGGMGKVHFGRISGAAGFSRIVAIKRHHPHLAKEPEFVSMLIDEARLAGRVRHPNVVSVLDVVQVPGELLLIMEYISGLSLAKLFRAASDRGERIPQRIACAIMAGVLQGLHAAHETRDDRGELLSLVHRDVSPQNVIVGADGLARVTDFGIALASERLSFTRTREIKGKLEYLSREQLRRERVDRRADVYAASVVLWEILTGSRPFADDTEKTAMQRIVAGDIPAPSTLAPEVGPELDQLVLRGLAPEAGARFDTALDMAAALERTVSLASQLEIATWIKATSGTDLAALQQRVAEVEAWTESARVSSAEETLVGSEEPSLHAATHALGEPPREALAEPEPPSTDERSVATAPATRRVVESASPEVAAPASLPGEPKRARERSLLVLPLVAFILGSILLIVVLTRSRQEPVSDVEGLRPSAPLIEASSPPAIAVVTGSVPRLVDAAASAPSAPGSAAAIPPKPPLAPPRPPKPKPNCTPPFTIDPQGVRVPKPECFK